MRLSESAAGSSDMARGAALKAARGAGANAVEHATRAARRIATKVFMVMGSWICFGVCVFCVFRALFQPDELYM